MRPLATLLLAACLLSSCTLAPESSGPAPRPPEAAVPEPNLPAPPPALSAPEIVLGGAKWTFGTSPKLEWLPVRGASRYQVQASTNPDFQPGSGVDFEVADSGDSGSRREAVLNVEVEPGETLHFRVRALGEANAASGWNKGARRVELAPPEILVPKPEARVQDARPRLTWAAIPGASSYEVVVAREGVEAHPIKAQVPADAAGNPSFRPAAPLPVPGIYKVSVRSLKEDLQSDWSTEKTFRFDPARPRILEPKAGEELTRSRPRLRWTPLEGEAPAYVVELCRGAGDGDCPDAESFEVAADSFELPERLALGASYRVRVRHRDSPFWSDPCAFSIVSRRQDPHAVRPIAADPLAQEVRVACSPDGLYLAIASFPADAEGEPVWTVNLYERSADGGELRPMPGAGLSGRTTGGLSVRTLDLTWSLGGGTVPVIFLGSWSLSSGGEPRGELRRFESWTPTLTDLLPRRFTDPIRSLTVPQLATNPRIYFETAPSTPGATSAAGEPGPFENLRDGQIWSVTLSGGDPKLHGPGRDPAISPDGRTLAYLADSDSVSQLRLLSLQSDEERVVDQGPSRIFGLQGPAWSPRGDRLALARDSGDGFDIVVIEVSTGRETLVTGSFENDLSPAFLPSARLDGSFDGILFTSKRDGKSWDVFLAEYRG